MLTNFIHFLKTIANNNQDEFTSLFNEVNPHDYNNIAFAIAIKYRRYKMAEKLLKLEDNQQWFDKLTYFARNEEKMVEFLINVWNQGVRGIKPLSTLLEDAGYNRDFFKFLLQNGSLFSQEEQKDLPGYLLSTEEYEIMKTLNYPFSVEFENKLKNHLGFINMTPEVIQYIKEGDLAKIEFSLSSSYINNMGIEKVEKIFQLIENHDKAKKYLQENLDYNKEFIINLDLLKLLKKYFDINFTYISEYTYLGNNIELIKYILEHSEFKEKTLHNAIKYVSKLDNFESLLDEIITPYIEKSHDENIDHIIFNKDNQLIRPIWAKFTVSQEVLKNMDLISKLKKFDKSLLFSPAILLRSSHEVQKYVVKYTLINDSISEKTYENDVFDVLLNKGMKIKKLSIDNIEVLKKYPQKNLSHATLEIKPQALNLEQAKWVIDLYLKDKIKIDDALINHLLLEEYKEPLLKKIIKKDIQNRFNFNSNINNLPIEWQLLVLEQNPSASHHIKIDSYENVKIFINHPTMKSIAIIKALEKGYFELIDKTQLKELLKNDLYKFNFNTYSTDYKVKYLNYFGVDEATLFCAIKDEEMLDIITSMVEKEKFEKQVNIANYATKKIKV